MPLPLPPRWSTPTSPPLRGASSAALPVPEAVREMTRGTTTGGAGGGGRSWREVAGGGTSELMHKPRASMPPPAAGCAMHSTPGLHGSDEMTATLPARCQRGTQSTHCSPGTFGSWRGCTAQSPPSPARSCRAGRQWWVRCAGGENVACNVDISGWDGNLAVAPEARLAVSTCAKRATSSSQHIGTLQHTHAPTPASSSA